MREVRVADPENPQIGIRLPLVQARVQTHPVRRLALAYFLLQAVAVAAWWATLAAFPASRPLFAIRDAPLVTLGAFAPGDLGLVAIGSALVALRAARPWATPLAWCIAGAMSYATLYTVTTALLGAAPALGAVLMAPAAVASLLAAAALSSNATRDPLPHRSAA